MTRWCTLRSIVAQMRVNHIHYKAVVFFSEGTGDSGRSGHFIPVLRVADISPLFSVFSCFYLGFFGSNLPDYQRSEIMLFIMGKVPVLGTSSHSLDTSYLGFVCFPTFYDYEALVK